MAVVALTGCAGSPGVTSTTLALQRAWPLQGRQLMLAECDPARGSVLFGALRGQFGDQYTLANLSVAGRGGADRFVEAFWRQLIDVSLSAKKDPPRSRVILPGFTDHRQAAGFAPVWEPLAQMLSGVGQNGLDVLVDLGRDGAFGPSSVLAQRADVVVMVARTTMPMVRDVMVRLEELEQQSRRVRLVLIEDDYPASYVLKELRQASVQVELLGTLPMARREAEVFSKGAEVWRGFDRSKLMLAAGAIAAGLKQEMLSAPVGVRHGG